MGTFVVACLSLVNLAEAPLAQGSLVHYRGTVAKVERDRSTQAAEKSFDLTIYFSRADAAGTDFYWLLNERGAGSFGWFDRVGTWSQDGEGNPVGPQGPALLFDYGTGKHVIALPPPIVALPATVEAGATWQRDGLDYAVARQSSAVERRAWEVEARNQFGPVRRVWADIDGRLLLQQDERVFMNQGTEYRLALQLRDVEAVAADERSRLEAGYAALVDLKTKTRRPPRKTDDAWTPAELEALAWHLPAMQRHIAGGALEQIATAAAADLRRLSDRSSGLDRLASERVGKAVEPFELQGLDGATLTAGDLRGAVTVLHFWDYRDQPLKEPYGQVGYLEFLRARRKPSGLKVYGIAVDGRFRDPEQAKTAAVGVRKLKNFMNLSYPVLFDGGELLERFGDPRPLGAELPLFVVVGADGKIVHWKVGHYEVDREAGLKQLDAIVSELPASPAK